jgi:hypothetical protein
MALVLGVGASLPLVLELFNHPAGGTQAPALHLEAQSTVHHTDRCLLDTFRSTPGTLLSDASAPVVRVPGWVPPRVVFPAPPLLLSDRPPLPRSPPANA